MIGDEAGHRDLLHDRDRILARGLDQSIKRLGLRSLLKEWATRYNAARPPMTLGPGVPDPPAGTVRCADDTSRHYLVAHTAVCVCSVLGGLHHEYSFALALA